ncbi:Eco57I restriction-modification methylase domain-containing protein [Pedobacter frigiditerrae]|uniref:Eco57I restriction-modification methylase domain-containing protein n=1 Tax=Pedobacter frigiditerrae TaxID=2530452 RepID=UPI0029313DC4|nr:DNA methyltransferase [Pedobacter frigiditerrae]
MKNNQLIKLLTRLGLENTVFFRTEDSNTYFFDFHIDVKSKLDTIKPDAVYVFNKQPFILFFDLIGDDDVARENEIHKKVWSFDNSPVIFIVKSSTIQIFNALNYIKNKEGNGGELEEINLTDEERDVRFSFWNLQSGETWKWFQNDYLENTKKRETRKRVNERLFQNIKEVRYYLTDTNNLNHLHDKQANSLILRLIFIRYLIDRGIKIDNGFISGETTNDKRKSFSNIIKQPKRLKELFANLNDKFNGVLFREFDIQLDQTHSDYLANVFKGELQEQGTLFEGYFFEIFDFSIIPVEVISGIYESLIDEETRELNSAVYTPSFLVDYILSDTVEDYLNKSQSSECTIFEVAVGSGIFLVQSLRRMIEKEIELNGKDDKEAFSNKIRDIAKRNLFGIDINREALKVTCFSIYIALLDYQEPKDVEQYPFPNFLDENLFEANFFNTAHEFNKVIKQSCPKFILGNPPWKSKKDDIVHTSWLKHNKKIVGRFEIAQSFLLRTKDFMQGDTRAALIVTSTIFYNVSKTTKKFKNEFLTTYCIDKFFDLSPVRRLIFEQKNSPATVIYYRLSQEKEYLNNVIDHQSVKSNRFLKYFKMLVIEKFDQKKILQKHFIDNDWMFKVALYGNTMDFILISKLYSLKTTSVQELIDNNVLFKGAGIERGKDPKPYYELLGLPIIENSEIKQDYSGIWKTKALTEKDIHLSRGRNKNIFIGSKILFKEQAFNESEPLVSYTKEDLVFRKGIFSISSKDDNYIKVLYTFFKSDLTCYFLYLISAAWGVGTRPAVRFDEEFLDLPFIEPTTETKTRLISLANQFLEPNKKFFNQFNLGEPERNEKILNEINSTINNLYKIKEHEKDLINYVLDVSRFQFQESKQHLFTRAIDSNEAFIEKYANVFIQEFENIYDEEFLQVEVYPLNYFIALNFIFLGSKPKKTIIYPNDKDEKEVLKKLANNLSIEQITNTQDPTKNLFVQKDIKGFEKNSFYIIKPNEYKCWHRAIAWYDVAEFKEAIELAELHSLKDQIND